MKILKSIFLIAVLFLFACEEESVEKTAGVFSLSFNIQDNIKNGSVNSTTNRPSSIFISIKDSKGNNVFSLRKLPLIKIGDVFLTEEVELHTDNYSIDEFIVANEFDSVLYMTPKEGSEFENLVSTPLPYTFSIASNDTTGVQLDVIPGNLGTPLQYGYTTFSFNVVNTLEKGIIAHYPLNGNALDYSGYEHDGFIGGATVVKGIKNENDSAYYFDGIDDYITFSTDNFGIDSTLSISLWVKTASEKYQWILGKYNREIDGGFHISTIDGIPRFNGRDGNDEYLKCLATDSINNDQWHHVACIIRNNSWSIWVDAFKVADTVNSHSIVNVACDYPLELGRYLMGDSNGEHYNFNGCIDEVKLYGRPLSEREIYQLYLMR